MRTAGKWVRRFRVEGAAELLDRSSAPHYVHNATPVERVEAITGPPANKTKLDAAG